MAKFSLLTRTVFSFSLLLVLAQLAEAQVYSANGPLSGKALHVKADTLQGALTVESERNKKFFFQAFEIEHNAGEQVIIQVVSPKMGVAVNLWRPGEKKPRYYADKFRETYPLEPSAVVVQLPFGIPGKYTLEVTSLVERAVGDFEVRVFRSSGDLGKLPYEAPLCEKLDAIAAYRELGFTGLRGKYLSADRKIHQYKQSAFLRVIQDFYAHVYAKDGAFYYETILMKTEDPLVGAAFFKELSEEISACFEGQEKWQLSDKRLGGEDDPGQYLFAGGNDPEKSPFSVSFEANKKRRGYYQVVLRMRESKQD